MQMTDTYRKTIQDVVRKALNGVSRRQDAQQAVLRAHAQFPNGWSSCTLKNLVVDGDGPFTVRFSLECNRGNIHEITVDDRVKAKMAS